MIEFTSKQVRLQGKGFFADKEGFREMWRQRTGRVPLRIEYGTTNCYRDEVSKE